MVKRVILILAAALLLVFAMTSLALAAATPQDIYDDYLDNSKLDNTYTQERNWKPISTTRPFISTAIPRSSPRWTSSSRKCWKQMSSRSPASRWSLP